MFLGGSLPADGAAASVSGPVIRMSPLVQPLPGTGDPPWVLPANLSPKQFSALVNLDMDAVKQDDVDLLDYFADRWLAGTVLNQPIQSYPLTFLPRIGHRHYADAKRAWQALL
jgi:hypothetical protein